MVNSNSESTKTEKRSCALHLHLPLWFAGMFALILIICGAVMGPPGFFGKSFKVSYCQLNVFLSYCCSMNQSQNQIRICVARVCQQAYIQKCN